MTERRRRVRTRADKVTLSRDAFTDVAVRLLEHQGAHAITLRRLAAELDTGPASLYGHVGTMQELHALVLDRVLGAVDLHPELQHDPHRRVEAVVDSYAVVLLAHRGLAELTSGLIAHGPNTFALTDTVVGCLLQLGLSPGRAAWGYDLLILRMTAAAAEQDRRRDLHEPKTRAADAYQQIDPAQYPNIAAVHDHLFTGGRSRTTWAIKTILAGLAAAPEPDAAPLPP